MGRYIIIDGIGYDRGDFAADRFAAFCAMAEDAGVRDIEAFIDYCRGDLGIEDPERVDFAIAEDFAAIEAEEPLWDLYREMVEDSMIAGELP